MWGHYNLTRRNPTVLFSHQSHFFPPFSTCHLGCWSTGCLSMLLCRKVSGKDWRNHVSLGYVILRYLVTYTPQNQQQKPLKIGLLPQKEAGSSSNHHFSSAFAVSFREGSKSSNFKNYSYIAPPQPINVMRVAPTRGKLRRNWSTSANKKTEQHSKKFFVNKKLKWFVLKEYFPSLVSSPLLQEHNNF